MDTTWRDRLRYRVDEFFERSLLPDPAGLSQGSPEVAAALG